MQANAVCVQSLPQIHPTNRRSPAHDGRAPGGTADFVQPRCRPLGLLAAGQSRVQWRGMSWSVPLESYQSAATLAAEMPSHAVAAADQTLNACPQNILPTADEYAAGADAACCAPNPVVPP